MISVEDPVISAAFSHLSHSYSRDFFVIFDRFDQIFCGVLDRFLYLIATFLYFFRLFGILFIFYGYCCASGVGPEFIEFGSSFVPALFASQ